MSLGIYKQMPNNPYKPIIDDIVQDFKDLHFNINRGLLLIKPENGEISRQRSVALRDLQEAVAYLERKELNQLQKVFE